MIRGRPHRSFAEKRLTNVVYSLKTYRNISILTPAQFLVKVRKGGVKRLKNVFRTISIQPGRIDNQTPMLNNATLQ